MKVMYIASENNMYSGAFLSLVTLAELMRARYHVEVFVILPYEGDGKKLLEERGIPYLTIRSCNWVEGIGETKNPILFLKKNLEIVYNVLPMLAIASIAKKNAVDIIHTNSTYSYVGSMAGYLIHIPVIWHLREFLEEDQNNKIWYRKKGYKIISKASTVVTISDALKKKYAKLLCTDKIRVIPNGIDIKKFYDVEHSYSVDGVVRCVCVGGLYKNKGHEVIIRAAKILIEKGINNFNIEFIGDGVHRGYLEKLTESLGLDEYVRFQGFYRDVVPFYRKADIAIMSSFSEAFGRVTVESMLQGLLVIGAKSGATSEILKDGEYGLLFSNKDYADLAEKLSFVIKHPDWLVMMAKKGQVYAKENYSAERNADAIFELYKSCYDC